MNKYNVATRDEFTKEYIKETEGQLLELMKWVNKNPKATYDDCKEVFGKDFTYSEYDDEDESSYLFDMYYGNMCITLERNGKEDDLHIVDGIELYNDDLTGGNGEFHYDEETVEYELKRKFNMDFYSVC